MYPRCGENHSFLPSPSELCRPVHAAFACAFANAKSPEATSVRSSTSTGTHPAYMAPKYARELAGLTSQLISTRSPGFSPIDRNFAAMPTMRPGTSLAGKLSPVAASIKVRTFSQPRDQPACEIPLTGDVHLRPYRVWIAPPCRSPSRSPLPSSHPRQRSIQKCARGYLPDSRAPWNPRQGTSSGDVSSVMVPGSTSKADLKAVCTFVNNSSMMQVPSLILCPTFTNLFLRS